MPLYLVRVPFAGVVNFEIDAATEEQAAQIALGIGISIPTITSEDGMPEPELEEWELYDYIVQGNVLYVPLNEIEVEEV